MKQVLSRLQFTEDGTIYQRSQLVHHDEGIAYLKSRKDEITESILACLKHRVTCHHPDLLSNTLTLLAIHGWEKSDNVDFADAAISALTTRFAVPLEKAGVDVTLVKEEWEDMVGYGK